MHFFVNVAQTGFIFEQIEIRHFTIRTGYVRMPHGHSINDTEGLYLMFSIIVKTRQGGCGYV